MLHELSDETRLVVSEPLGDLAGAWNEVPESSYGVIQEGQDELHPFTPRPPGIAGTERGAVSAHAARLDGVGPIGGRAVPDARHLAAGRRWRRRSGLHEPTGSARPSSGRAWGGVWWAPWRVSWWIGVLFAIGSTCFFVGPFPGFVELVGSQVDGIVFFVGSIFFTSAAALQWLETINAQQVPVRTQATAFAS